MKKLAFDNCKNIISQQVKHYRKQSDLTQAQLAARLQTIGLNIDQQMVSKIEHNTRIVTDYELACIATVLKVSPLDLLQPFYSKYELE